MKRSPREQLRAARLATATLDGCHNRYLSGHPLRDVALDAKPRAEAALQTLSDAGLPQPSWLQPFAPYWTMPKRRAA